jgi:serine/threonine protein phosphatase PrpC
MALVSLYVVSVPGTPDRVNEDGWVVVEDPTPPGWIAAAVIDGASARGIMPSLRDYLNSQGYEASPAVWATSVVRSALYRVLTTPSKISPGKALLEANRTLRSAVQAVPSLAQVYARLEERPVAPLPDVFARCAPPLARELRQVFDAMFPALQWHSLDARYLRLILPACVATVVRCDMSSACFEFAHVGDTTLLHVDQAGEVCTLTQDQMGAFDDVVLESAFKAIRQDKLARNVAHAVQVVDTVRQANWLNGVRHNYVDQHGYTRPGEGCGVLNGLTELADYIQTGTGHLTLGERLCVASDGLTLPMSRHAENLPPLVRNSVAEWKQAMRVGDAWTMLRYTQAIAEVDATCDLFPRVKQYDDATAVLITLQ